MIAWIFSKYVQKECDFFVLYIVWFKFFLIIKFKYRCSLEASGSDKRVQLLTYLNFFICKHWTDDGADDCYAYKQNETPYVQLLLIV